MIAGSCQSFALERMAEGTAQGLSFALPWLEKDIALIRAILSEDPRLRSVDDITQIGISTFAGYAGHN
jgi:hypothetical protein